MDSIGVKTHPVMRKAKNLKKQVKDELDRQKQAEKKKRRLEKALATSAAIISELEKKKQKKKEDQQRLEEEGAAIAEAVALHVLLEDETNDPSKFGFNKDGIFKCLRRERSNSLYQGSRSCSREHIGFGLHDLRQDQWPFLFDPHNGDKMRSYSNKIGWGLPGIPASLIAAQAVSSLRIADDEHKG